MKKVAVFVEGQTELIFIRKLLQIVFEYTDINIKSSNLVGGIRAKKIVEDYLVPNAQIEFTIFSVDNDNRVLGEMKLRERNLFERGYTLVVGIRDMYGEDYKDAIREMGLPPQTVSRIINDKFRNQSLETIKKMSDPTNIYLIFSVMEIEAWILGIKDFLFKVDSRLTHNHIKALVGHSLHEVEIEDVIYHPAKVLRRILESVSFDYDKSRAALHSILSKLDASDIEYMTQLGKVSSFNEFHQLIVSLKPTANSQ